MTKNVSRETKFLKKKPSIQLFLEASTSNTGVVIYEEKSKRILLDDINLSKIKKPLQMKPEDFEKLKFGCIKNYLDTLKNQYFITGVYMEGIFIYPKRLKSSQTLLKLHGFLMSYFIDTPQYFLSPSVIKKNITGDGHAKKETVREILGLKYGYIFPNEDISDAFALFASYHEDIDKNKITVKEEDNERL